MFLFVSAHKDRAFYRQLISSKPIYKVLELLALEKRRNSLIHGIPRQSHDNIHETNSEKCPIQIQCG